MKKLSLIVSLTIVVSLAGCMDRQVDGAEPAADSIAEIQSELIVEDPCTAQLHADIAACDQQFELCMSAAQSRLDRIACSIAYAACIAVATKRYIDCIRSTPVPGTPAPAPVPGTPVPGTPLSPSATSRLDARDPGALPALTSAPGPLACAFAA